jgi:hypothetical protein
VAHLDLEVESALLNEAIATILLELRGWLSSRVGKAISQPSTIRTDARLTVFALRNVGDNIEAAVLALSAQSMAFRRALEVSDSLLAIDESPILFKYNGIAQIIGQVCANGAKSGIRPSDYRSGPGYHRQFGRRVADSAKPEYPLGWSDSAQRPALLPTALRL